MNAPQNHSFSCLDRRADPHDYVIQRPAIYAKAMTEFEQFLNDLDQKRMNQKYEAVPVRVTAMGGLDEIAPAPRFSQDGLTAAYMAFGGAA